MQTKIYTIFLTIFFFSVFIILYKGLQKPNVYIPKLKTKIEVPSFDAKIFKNNTKINSKEIFKKDKFYLFNIWASWCLPCRDEHSILVDLSNQKNLQIIGLNYKDNDKNAEKFLVELNSPYKIILSDKDGTIAIEWGAYGVPESFLVYNNEIIKKIIGPLNINISAEIKDLIK